MRWLLQVVSLIIFLVSVRPGGCIGIFYKSGLTVTVSKPDSTEIYTHFLNVDFTINIAKENGFRNSISFVEWSIYLDNIAIMPYHIIITGDLNFHMDIKFNCEARRFCIVLDAHGLTQHFNSVTHKHIRFGHLSRIECHRSRNSFI